MRVYQRTGDSIYLFIGKYSKIWSEKGKKKRRRKRQLGRIREETKAKLICTPLSSRYIHTPTATRAHPSSTTHGIIVLQRGKKQKTIIWPVPSRWPLEQWGGSLGTISRGGTFSFEVFSVWWLSFLVILRSIAWVRGAEAAKLLRTYLITWLYINGWGYVFYLSADHSRHKTMWNMRN